MKKEDFEKAWRETWPDKTIHLHNNNAMIFADEYSFLDGDKVRFRSYGEITAECDLRDIKEVKG